MLRYGLSFEDIENLKSHIKHIDSEGIIFNDSIRDVPNQFKKSIERYLD
jgi:ABC-type uncharacterized transport system ATPase subunit